MSEVTRMSIGISDQTNAPQLETTVSESARLALAERERAEREERFAQQIIDGKAGPRPRCLRELDAETLKQEKEDDRLGYDMPDRESYDDDELQPDDEDDDKSIYDMDCQTVRERRARRDARAAMRAQLDAEATESAGYIAAIPAKVARKRAEGRVRVEPAMGPNGTKCDHRPGGISDAQEKAILLLLIGKSDRAIACEVGVHRHTVARWRGLESFRVALFNAQRRVWGAGINKVRAMMFESLNEMRKQLKDKKSSNNRFRAAQTLVNLVGLERLAPQKDEYVDDESLSGDDDAEEEDQVA